MSSFKSILKSTGLIGFFEVFRLAIGLVRNKLVAVFLGASGIGVWGLYLSFTELLQGVSSLGLEKSTVKAIAENNDDLRERDTIIKVAQFSFITFSFVCALIGSLFSEWFSQNIFGDTEHKTGILICCLVVFLNSLTNFYKAVLNGLRQINKLVVSQLIGVLFGNVIVVSLIPFLGIEYIPLFLLIVSITSFVPVFLYVKRNNIPYIKINFREAYKRFSFLMKIGVAFWISGMVAMLMAYLIKVFLQKELSIEMVGVYQASWTISNLYVGIILTSMGVDFFPKVCASIRDKITTNRLINDQIEFGLLVSIPFIVGIICFASFLLRLLYSKEFEVGASIIRWQMVGVTIRLLGFPFSYVLMAKGKGISYTILQIGFHSLNYFLIIYLVESSGVRFLGLNYLFSYVIYLVLISVFCYKYLNYRVSKELLKTVLVTVSLVVITLVLTYFADFIFFYFLIIIITSCYSMIQLKSKLDFDIIGFIKTKLNK
tara:strand:- start:15018 stop:16475 length:1458 start_codon:yes stop_codon:yes gene_type:complete